MPFFCIHDHPQMPLTRVAIEKRARESDKFGFRLRFSHEFPDAQADHAREIIELMDTAMGRQTKAPGVYQARFDEVWAAYQGLPRDPPPPERADWSEVLRPVAGIAAFGLLAAMCTVLPIGTIMWLFISAFKRQSGLLTMAESAVLWSILDWRPTIRKLLFYARYGQWPK